MTSIEQDDMYAKIKDIHKMVKDIWISLKQGDPNDDAKDFIMNIIANLAATNIENKNDRSRQGNSTGSSNIGTVL